MQSSSMFSPNVNKVENGKDESKFSFIHEPKLLSSF
jgi:hypothetical protein